MSVLDDYHEWYLSKKDWLEGRGFETEFVSSEDRDGPWSRLSLQHENVSASIKVYVNRPGRRQVIQKGFYWTSGDPILTYLSEMEVQEESPISAAEFYLDKFIEAASNPQPRPKPHSFYERKVVPFFEKTMPFPGLVIVFAIVCGWLLIRLLQIPTAS